MASQEEINNQRDLSEEINQSAANARNLADAQRDVLFFTRDFAAEAKEAAKAVFDNSIQASETAKAFRDVANAAKQITDNYAEVITGEKSFQDLIKERDALNAATNSFNTEYEQFLQTVIKDQESINQILEGTLDPYDALSESVEGLNEDNFRLLELYTEQTKELEQEAKNLAEIERRAGNIEDSMKLFGKDSIGLADAAEGISKGFSKAGLGNLSSKLGLEDAITDTRKFASSLTKGGDSVAKGADKMKIMKNFAGNLAGNLTKALGPASLIATAIEQVVSAFMLIDKSSGEIAKSMGVSAAEGAKLAASSADAAAMSGDLLVSTKDVVAAQMELNQAMGTAVEFSGEFAAEFASIKERTGLSNEAMAMFSQNALVAGTSIKDQLSTVSAVTMEMNAQSGVMLNAKDIQEGIAKLSKAQQLTAGRNTKEMAKQVIQAKLLGASMQQVASIGESLLNFESSIASEMEAELLTGKQLNLEKARMAALTGDEATLAEEIRKNVGTAAEFGKMNKIQQEALAKSFGMQKDELAEMLMNQENLEAVKKAGFESTSEAQEAFNKLIEDGMTAEQAAAEMKRKGLDDAFTAQMKSATAQDKMNAAMEKLTDLFVQIVDPLMPLVDALMDILNPIFAILSPIMKLIGDLVGLVMGVLAPTLELLSKQFNGITDVLYGIFTLDFSQMLNGFKLIGQSILDLIFLPLDSAINLLNFIPGVDIPDISTSVGGMIGLAEGGIVTEPTTALIGEGGEPEAVTPLSKIGSFVSDIMGGGEQEASSGTPIDIGPLVTQMTQMNNTLNAILAKEGTVTLDGTKVGTALTVANSKLQ